MCGHSAATKAPGCAPPMWSGVKMPWPGWADGPPDPPPPAWPVIRRGLWRCAPLAASPSHCQHKCESAAPLDSRAGPARHCHQCGCISLRNDRIRSQPRRISARFPGIVDGVEIRTRSPAKSRLTERNRNGTKSARQGIGNPAYAGWLSTVHPQAVKRGSRCFGGIVLSGPAGGLERSDDGRFGSARFGYVRFGDDG